MKGKGEEMIKYKPNSKYKEAIEYRVVPPPYRCPWCGEKMHDRYHKPITTGKDGLDYCSPYCAHESWIAQENDRCNRWPDVANSQNGEGGELSTK